MMMLVSIADFFKVEIGDIKATYLDTVKKQTIKQIKQVANLYYIKIIGTADKQ